MRSYEEWARRVHLDLPELTLDELRAQHARLRLRLLLDAAPDDWFRERLAAVEQALRHAQRGSR